MARRTHLKEAGLVAFDDLGELGAGRKEGWLADDSVLAALHSGYLALANRSLVVVLRWGGASSGAYGDVDGPPIKIRPSLSPPEGEITALQWLALEDFLALAVGTSGGYLLLYCVLFQPEPIHKQIVHSARILKLRLREIEDEFNPDTFSQELCVVMPGVIARFDGSDIKRLLQGWLEDRHSNGWDYAGPKKEGGEGDLNLRIPYQLWNVSKYGSCADAAISGIMPPPLLELQGSHNNGIIVQLPLEMMLLFLHSESQKIEAGPWLVPSYQR